MTFFFLWPTESEQLNTQYWERKINLDSPGLYIKSSLQLKLQYDYP